MAFVSFLIASALLSLVPIEQSQAQLIINVYPSQDNPTNQTLWIFSGSSTAGSSNSIRASGSYNSRDSWEVTNNNGDWHIFDANKPSNQTISLSPLFASSNSKDIASVNARIPEGGKTNITFAASATNTPTITIGSGSRTIANLFLDDGGSSFSDVAGIRVSGSNLSYSSGDTSAWVGAGILNKPIGDFFAGTFDNFVSGSNWDPRFAAQSNGSLRVVFNTQVIPEPQEYALVFGLFALGFVFFRRHFQKKRRQAATS